MAEAPPLMRKMQRCHLRAADAERACSMASAADAPANDASFGVGCPPGKNWMVGGRVGRAFGGDRTPLRSQVGGSGAGEREQGR